MFVGGIVCGAPEEGGLGGGSRRVLILLPNGWSRDPSLAFPGGRSGRGTCMEGGVVAEVGFEVSPG
jgi:hypothetical protein